MERAQHPFAMKQALVFPEVQKQWFSKIIIRNLWGDLEEYRFLNNS